MIGGTSSFDIVKLLAIIYEQCVEHAKLSDYIDPYELPHEILYGVTSGGCFTHLVK